MPRLFRPLQLSLTSHQFNIFYPDLIDKTKAPTYKIVRDPNDTDTCLLYFSAGPPYEDIAFRIVDREWEYSHKRRDFSYILYDIVLTWVNRGFRSSFDRGCLSLWFNFRRNVSLSIFPYRRLTNIWHQFYRK